MQTRFLPRHHVPRRCLSRSASSTKDRLRALLRETAQPVAVVTSFMPVAEKPDQKTRPRFHGATLSSFTSVAMDPFPVVSFALRIPSRMATALNAASGASETDMVINLLAAHQAGVATTFARADLHPHPFDHTPYLLTADGLPAIRGALGALSCKLVSRGISLHDARLLRERRLDQPPEYPPDGDIVSQLFIAQVTRVEELGDDDDRTQLPLLYHRRRYTTVDD